MAKKKEIEKEVETKEETKLTFNDIKKKCLKYIKTNKDIIIRGTISFAIALLVIIVGVAAIDAIKENSLDNIDYPLVYRKESGEIMLLESEDATGKDAYMLSTSDGTGYTTYGNVSNRYVLTKKENDLYIYDTKKEEQPSKITDDVSVFYFSDKDSYVIMLDADGDLFSYNYKEAKKMLDGNVSSIIDYSDKAVIYNKDGKLNYISLNPDKGDRKTLLKKYKIAEFSKDGKSVLYTNSNDVLYRYDIRKDKHTKIGENVDSFYCDEKSCEKLYFSSKNITYSLNYYDGKKNVEIVKNYYDVEQIDVEEEKVIYSTIEGGDTKLYYQKGDNQKYEIPINFDISSGIKMLENSVYILDNKKELKFAKIKGSKIGKFSTIDKEIESALMDYKDGVYYYKNRNNEGEATYYIAVDGKKTKIADDIKDTKISVSNNGKKIYYINKSEENSGVLNVFDGKKNKKISEDVYRFLYIRDDMVYYIKNFDIDNRFGELYRYNGSSKVIEEKVSDLSSTPNAYIVK